MPAGQAVDDNGHIPHSEGEARSVFPICEFVEQALPVAGGGIGSGVVAGGVEGKDAECAAVPASNDPTAPGIALVGDIETSAGWTARRRTARSSGTACQSPCTQGPRSPSPMSPGGGRRVDSMAPATSSSSREADSKSGSDADGHSGSSHSLAFLGEGCGQPRFTQGDQAKIHTLRAVGRTAHRRTETLRSRLVTSQ